MTLLVTAGCEPLPFIEAEGTSGDIARFVPLPEQEVGGGARELAAVTGPVATLRYAVDPEKRIYLIRAT